MHKSSKILNLEIKKGTQVENLKLLVQAARRRRQRTAHKKADFREYVTLFFSFTRLDDGSSPGGGGGAHTTAVRRSGSQGSRLACGAVWAWEARRAWAGDGAARRSL